MKNRKKAYVDFEAIKKFTYDMIANTIDNSYILDEDQKEDFAIELNHAINIADFSVVPVYVINE